MNNEKWKDIEGYEGYYQVSNYGNVKSLERIKRGKGNAKIKLNEKLLVQRLDYCGYLVVHLCKEGKVKTFKVHRLVAQAFISNPFNKETVNHIDELKTNNNVENLEWMTFLENIRYGKLRSKKISKAKSRPILQFDVNENYVKRYCSATEASEINKIPLSNIVECAGGKHKHAGGYIWKYESDTT